MKWRGKISRTRALKLGKLALVWMVLWILIALFILIKCPFPIPTGG